MTMQDAIALQPEWVGHWLKWLFFGAFLLPLALLVWKESRVAAVVTVVASVAGGFATNWLYGIYGYVKLLGLPHIVVWTPLAIYLVVQMRKPDMPKAPRVIMGVVLGTIVISLAFDYADVVRYVLGEQTPLAGSI